MLTVKYERYYNDYNKSYETRSFDGFTELTDWLFGMVKGEYKKNMWFTNPEDDHIFDGKLRLDGSCIKSYDGKFTHWIEQIEKDGKIIYSTGTFTNGISYWNDDIRQWLRDCRNRMNNPTFNFG